MPCRVSSDVHEWINEGLTVSAWSRVNLQPSAQSRDPRWGEKTPWSFTAASSCDIFPAA
jgi:hypothetical protein